MPTIAERKLMLFAPKKNNGPKKFNNGTKFPSISNRITAFGGRVAKKNNAPKVPSLINRLKNSLKKNIPARNLAAKAIANKKRNNNRGVVGRLMNGRRLTNNEKNMLAASGSY
jgi:hypothetical protein